MALSEDDLAHLIISNDPPTELQATSVRHEVEKLEAEILELEPRLQVLKTRLGKYKPIISPWRRVPLEILGEIFLRMRPFYTKDQDFLVVVCKVCKAWRTAAHSVPHLWTTITINKQVPALSYEKVDAWLRRSGTLPKSVFVYADMCQYQAVRKPKVDRLDDDDDGATAICSEERCVFLTPALAQILHSGPPLQSFRIRCPTARCFNNFARVLEQYRQRLSGSTTSWDALKKFTLAKKPFWTWSDWKSQGLSLELLAPSLRSLTLYLPSEPYEARQPTVRALDIRPPSLQHLTTLNITSDFLGAQVLQTLEHCKSLRVLKLDFEYCASCDRNQDPVFMTRIMRDGLVLPNVREVRLDNMEIDSLLFLQPLQMPALRKFSIRFGNDWSTGPDFDEGNLTPDHVQALASLLRGNPEEESKLHSISIQYAMFNEDSIFEIFKPLTSLVKIEMEDVYVAPDAFAQLLEPRPNPFLPNLRSLRLLWIHEDGQDTDSILEPLAQERGIELDVTVHFQEHESWDESEDESE